MIRDYEKAKQYAYRLRTQTLDEDVNLLYGLKENRLLALIDFHIKYGYEGMVSHFKVEDDFGIIRIEHQQCVFLEDVEYLMGQVKRIQQNVQACMNRTTEVDESVYQSFCCRYLVDRKLKLTELDHDDYLDILIEDYDYHQMVFSSILED